MIGRFIYPKGGWSRAVYYVVHRLRRLPDPPHRIARGVAVGVFVCFTPFFGLHFLMAAIIAYAIQANLVAALLATFFGNPITFPIIAAISLELGQWILGTPIHVPLSDIFTEFGRASGELWQNMKAIVTDDVAHWRSLHRFFWRVGWPYVVGGLLPGFITAVFFYWITLPAVSAYQKRRVRKLRERF